MKRNKLLPVLLISLITSTAYSQPFTALTTSVQAAGRSALAWGDHDNDGDLDLVVSGIMANGTYRTTIYDNDEGNLIVNDAALTGVKDGSVAWGDFDMDGDLDILLSGQTMENSDLTMIYRNEDGIFKEFETGLPGIGYGEACWGDYDNDGDLDIMLAGNWMAGIYENSGGSFTLTENDFGPLNNARCTWGDFDNDGDLDILLMGDTGGGYLTEVFINHGGTFMSAGLGLTGLVSGTADMIDFDNDGDLDIALTGFDIYLEPQFLTYENLGDGNISPMDNLMEGIATSAVDWGDYDNDGDLDLLMCGKTGSCGGAVSKVYQNTEGFFLMEPTAVLEGIIRSGAGWADYDNDGDLDIMISGLTPAEYPFARLYRNESGNNIFEPNTIPQSPQGLQSFVNGSSVILVWDQSNDDQTPQEGLSYNLRLGASAGGSELMSPMADNQNGRRYVQALGNVNQQNSWIINQLEPGTYFWSVQAIDQGYAGSAFAPEATFTVHVTGLSERTNMQVKGVFPNPATAYIFLDTQLSGDIEIRILDLNGREVKREVISAGNPVDISSLPGGQYLLMARQGVHTSTLHFIRK